MLSLCVNKTYPSGTCFPVQDRGQEWGPLSNTVEVKADESLMAGPPEGSDQQILQPRLLKTTR